LSPDAGRGEGVENYGFGISEFGIRNSALLRSVSAGSLSFLLRQGFGERVGGFESVKVRKLKKTASFLKNGGLIMDGDVDGKRSGGSGRIRPLGAG